MQVPVATMQKQPECIHRLVSMCWDQGQVAAAAVLVGSRSYRIRDAARDIARITKPEDIVNERLHIGKH